MGSGACNPTGKFAFSPHTLREPTPSPFSNHRTCERHFQAPANSGTGYLTPSGPRQKQNATRFSLDSQNSPSGWTHVGQATPRQPRTCYTHAVAKFEAQLGTDERHDGGRQVLI